WRRPGRRVRQTRWRPFDRVFTDGSRAQRFLRETIFGTRRAVRFFQITTDPQTLPPETTWDLMTNLPGKIESTVGNTFGLRTWMEIVCTQMTKPHLFSLRRGGNNVANLYLPIRHHPPVE